jgi:glyceraldehyde 3-phosphate dehydrogenase
MTLALEHPALEVVGANDISQPDSLAYVIKYDSVYGKFQGSVNVEHVSDEVWLQVGTRRLRLYAERHPGALPWKALGVSDRRRSHWCV